MARRPASREPAFDFSGGAAPLDFVNTVSSRLCDGEKDLLSDYGDLVAWGRQAGLIDKPRAAALRRIAVKQSARAAVTLGRARKLREALFRILTAISGGMRPERKDIGILNDFLKEAMGRLCLEDTPEGLRWCWRQEETALDLILWPISRSAAELLTSSDLERVSECNASGCHWLFLDRSRNRSRRWCDMKSCGNRTKVRRHYQKKKGVTGS
jgi:predicted RNA-binding Zn ribbon-like protein